MRLDNPAKRNNAPSCLDHGDDDYYRPPSTMYKYPAARVPIMVPMMDVG